MRKKEEKIKINYFNFLMKFRGIYEEKKEKNQL